MSLKTLQDFTMQRVAIYPGTFDPITNGHLDIIRRSVGIFELVIVAVAQNHAKNPMFSLQSRIQMLEIATKDIERVRIEGFDCLLADFAKQKASNILIRGLRAVSDFEYELQMGYINTSLDSKLETIYFMPLLQHAFISSSVVRSIIEHNGRFSHLVPEGVSEYIQSLK